LEAFSCYRKQMLRYKIVYSHIFFQVILCSETSADKSAWRSRDFRISLGAFLAAAGGENRPNYFKNIP